MSNCKEKKLTKVFIFLNILYITQGLIPAIDPIYKLILLFILTFSMYYTYKVNTEFGVSKFIKALNIFILLITVYGIIYIFNPSEETIRILSDYRPDYKPYTYLTNAYRPLLQIYPLYYFSRKGYIDEDLIKRCIIPSFIAVIIAFYVDNLTAEAVATTLGDVERTSNIGYLVVSIIPLLFFMKRTIAKYFVLALIIVMAVFCAKRGAILIAGLLSVWFLYFEMKSSSLTKKLRTIILVGVAGAILLKYLSELFENSYYLNYLVEKTIEGDSSGRDNLYTQAWNHFVDGSLISVLFGNGADSTYRILGNRAHNDWLELLTNQGLLGVIVYAYLWVIIIIEWIQSKKNTFVFRVFGSIVILFFLKTLFSMLYNDLSVVSCIPFAWCLATVESESIINLRNKKKKGYV